MNNQNSPFGNPQDRYAHPYLNDSYNYAPINPYGASGGTTSPSSLPSGIGVMRSITLWLGAIIAVCTIIFELSQMKDSIISISNFPPVGYAYMFMYLTHPYIMLAFAYGIVWITSIKGRGFEKPKHTWLLAGSAFIIIGRIVWDTLSIILTIT